MNKKKFTFHWGWAIVLVFLTFMMTFSYQFWLSFKINKTNDLVVEDYYTAELQYGEELQKIKAADTMKKPVMLEQQNEKLILKFPGYIDASKINGQITFLRVNNKNLDRKAKIKLDSTNTQLFSTDSLLFGRWDYIIQWNYEGKEYLKKGKLYVK